MERKGDYQSSHFLNYPIQKVSTLVKKEALKELYEKNLIS
jgi:hypothetical protein